MNISYFSKVYKNLHLFLIIQSFFFSLFIIYYLLFIIYYLRLFYLFLFFKIIIVRRPPSAVHRPHPPSGSAVRIRTLQSPFKQSVNRFAEKYFLLLLVVAEERDSLSCD